MKIHTRIHADYFQNLLARSANVQRHNRETARAEGGRGLVAGLCQMENRCGGERGKERNLARMLKAIRLAARRGVRLLAFPEMALPGYFTWVAGTAEAAREAARALADAPASSPHLRRLRRAAREAGMALAFGFAERAGKRVYNSIGVIDADGRWLGAHRKNPLFPWPYELEPFDEPAKDRRVSVFRTRVAAIGVANCFDGSFPETVRAMRLAGAELLVWCNAAVGDSRLGNGDRVPQAGGHAVFNKLFVICCNCVGENVSGSSSICDCDGEPLVILPPREEGLAVAELNLARAANWDIYRTRLCLRPKSQG